VKQPRQSDAHRTTCITSKRKLLLFAGRIASRLGGSIRTGDIRLVKGILSQLILTGIVQGYQHFQILFAHVHLQSKYKLKST